MPKEAQGVVVSTWLRPQEAATLRTRALDADRTMAAEVRRALRSYLNTTEPQASTDRRVAGTPV